MKKFPLTRSLEIGHQPLSEGISSTEAEHPSLRFNDTLSTTHPLLINQIESVLGTVINQTKSISIILLK